MKLVIDEKLKYRLVGIAVILSLGAIFLPAIMKGSNSRLENNFSVRVKLPPKPPAPKVVVTEKEKMFATIKVAKIVPSPISERKESELDKKDFIQPVHIVNENSVKKAASINIEPVSNVNQKPIELALNEAAKNTGKRLIKIAPQHAIKQTTNVKAKRLVVKKPIMAHTNSHSVVNKKEVYAVQLASFSKLTNAQTLVNKLKKMGYKANYVKVNVRNGVAYKVYAGHAAIKRDAARLRTRLANAVQLNGFIVNTGVS